MEQDTISIIGVINLYGLAMDTQRWDLFDRIFTADVEADFSAAARWQDRASFKRDFAAFHAPFDNTQHVMMNHLVEVKGDVAHAFTYGNWRLVRKAADGSPFWEGTGWYDDALIRSPEGWRIRRRVCRIVTWSGNALVNETIPGVKFALNSTVLRHEGEAGKIGFLNAISL